MPLPDQSQRELEAMDAAVRGEAVDPEFAEFAELALLLADSRPRLTATGAATLDRRVGGLAGPATQRPPRHRWFLRPAFGAGLALVLILGALVVVLPRGGTTARSGPELNSALNAKGAHAGASSAAAGTANSASGVSSPAAAPKSLASTPPLAAVPTPQSNGRRIVQSSQLSLTTPAGRIATVAQELFDVVGTEQGIVKHSQVSSGTDGYASFTLSIPTANLPATLSRLAQLRYATVVSSTATTSDVNSQYLNDERALADAKALRASLLTQLEGATTTAAIDSLKAQIHAAEASIAGDESRLNNLQSQISYSAVSVQINAGNVVPPPVSGGGFTFRRAAHDALAVLTVAAGVALVALAGLVPLGLLIALVAWAGFGWRRWRRERALDAV